MLKKVTWLERQFVFGLPKGMLPFYVERLDGTCVRLLEKTRGLSEDLASMKVEGKWSVKENIAHLAEIGKISDKRVEEIVGEMEVFSPAMLPLTMDYNVRPIADILEIFRTVRSRSVVNYLRLQESDLDKSSLHPRLKVKMTAVDLAWFDAEHDDHHLVRINEILAILKKTAR